MTPPLFHVIFLAILVLCCVGFFLWPLRGKSIEARIIGGLFLVLFAGLLLHQACWQLSGFGSLGFQKFQRRYDVRPATLARTAEARGRLLDRNGKLLAEGIPGKRWGHKTPLGAAGLQTVGYSSREFGLSGLERVFDARLCGHEPPDGVADLLKRSKPEDVRTTLDSRLQRLAYDALDGRKGAVVALDPRTGAVLALVSSPSLDESEANLRKAMKDKKNAPLFHRATHGLYAPGSVFKLFTAALALENRKAGTYACPPNGWAPGAYTKPIRDSHPRPAEDPMMDLRPAFAESSNIWFAKAATACTWPVFHKGIVRCGLTEGIRLAECGDRSMGTVSGKVPDLKTARNRVAYLGFGQGELELTPVHIAALTASIANRGVLMPLHLEAGCAGSGKRIWSQSIADRVATLMRASVLEGTSRGVAIPGVAVCGKTGTAETSGRDHAWFTCFAPEKNPQIVVTVLVENGGYGAATALPIAKELLKAALKK